MDFVAFVGGTRQFYKKAYRKIQKVLIVGSYFGTQEWNFTSNNTDELLGKTKNFKFNRGEHDFDFHSVDWKKFFVNFMPGINRYFFKEIDGSLKPEK